MIKLRKVLSGVVAAAVLAANSAIMTSAATTYDPCDVNHDGIVNVRDAFAISQFLKGNILEPNYNRFDANKSLTIDAQDVQCVMNKINGKSYKIRYISKKTGNEYTPPTISGYNPDYTANLTDPVQYRKYTYTTKREDARPYTLYPANINTLLPYASSKNGATRSIVDNDDRYETSGPECTGIVKISNERIPNSNSYGGVCTGFIVDDHVIATSAVNVYSAVGWEDIKIETYMRNGALSGRTLTPVEAHIPENYRNLGTDEDNYALITVKENLSGYVHFALGNSYNVKENDYRRIPIHVTGCPEAGVNNINSGYILFTGEGRIKGNDNTDIINYNCDVVEGNNGSPVYTVTNNYTNGVKSNTYTALGINNSDSNDFGSSNSGVLITKYLTQFYLNNSNINY